MARSVRQKGSGVTIQAVAEHAGVSSMTVSNVVNGSGRVSQATRAAVMQAIRDLGYTPNAAASALAGSGVKRIGLIYHDPQNAVLSAILVGALNAVTAKGAQLLIRPCPDLTAAAVERELRALVKAGANGLLLTGQFCEMLGGTALARDLGVPLAAIAPGRMLPGMASFRVDDEAAARAMTHLLIARGRRRIGFIAGPPHHSSSAARIEGWRAALREAGQDADPALLAIGDFSFESGLGAAGQLLDLPRPPDAIFASNDDMAAATVSLAHRRGLAVPRDLAVCGFDDTPIAVKTWPRLTTVRQPVADIAQKAATWLIDTLVSQGTSDEAAEVLLPYLIVERDSA